MTIEGSLDSVDIQDVAQLLNLNRSSGTLHIKGEALVGAVFFEDGEVVNAEVEGMTGEAAAYVLLGESKGSFHFQMGGHNMARLIQRSIHDLVLEAARRKDTIRKIRATITNDNIIYLPLVDVRIPHLAKDFNPIEKKLLAALDGQTDIQAIISKQKESAFEVLYVIYDLEKRDFLKRVNVYKLLGVEELKKLFGKYNEVHISDRVMEDWTNESMTYSNCETVEIRTKDGAYGQVPVAAKSNIDPEKIFIPKDIMQQFGIAPGQSVLIKPIINPLE